METDEVERRIEAAIDDAEASVSLPRVPDEDHEDAHFAAVVVSPAFEGLSLVDQHELVYDALGEAMTTEIHALELKTYTPEEYRESN
ncbi:BolA family protein [Halobellus marinus]|jgi:stress-induced morphogen|uniref:BolA family protein n=1 Tax=Halobellus TaxID=1073986 RepID=UPI0028A7259A|nr:BolA family protein [Halobellus sp. DFY28]